VSQRRHANWLAPLDPLVAAAERARLGLTGGPVVLLYTRFDVVAPARVLALLAALRAHQPTVRLLVVGQGLAGEEGELRRRAMATGLASAIVEAGFVDFERLPTLLRLADAAIYPIDDTLINRAKAPMKLLELLALGLPVVAERVGEVGEYIEAGRSGRLVNQGAPDELAAAVGELLADEGERQRLGRAAYARAWQVYNWSTLVQGVEIIYRQAIA
jgi:glycosyltransferase involved in cell wall biosynthesis